MSKTNQNPEVAEVPETAFVEITFMGPNLWMCFKATPKRMERVADFMLREAAEAESEYENSLKD